MKTQLIIVAILTTAMIGFSACAPIPPKAERMPGEPQDPGKIDEAAAEEADRQGNRRAAKEHRARAIVRRMECNIITILIGLIDEEAARLCVSPTDDQPQPPRLL
jgi:hypothetical protein